VDSFDVNLVSFDQKSVWFLAELADAPQGHDKHLVFGDASKFRLIRPDGRQTLS
jgi:hypothetical protein